MRIIGNIVLISKRKITRKIKKNSISPKKWRKLKERSSEKRKSIRSKRL